MSNKSETGSSSRRASLGGGRLRGLVEMAVWLSIAAVILAGAIWSGGPSEWVLAAVLIAALSHYAIKSVRVIRGGPLVADAARRAFYRGGRRVVGFDEIVALRSHMVNASCAEFELSAECRDGNRLVLYEGEATNAAYHQLESMAALAGVPFHHELKAGAGGRPGLDQCAAAGRNSRGSRGEDTRSANP